MNDKMPGRFLRECVSDLSCEAALYANLHKLQVEGSQQDVDASGVRLGKTEGTCGYAGKQLIETLGAGSQHLPLLYI